MPGPDPHRSASLCPFQEVLANLRQGQLGRAILDEAHGVRPALLQAVGAARVGQGNLDDVVLRFVPRGTAGEGQAEVSARELSGVSRQMEPAYFSSSTQPSTGFQGEDTKSKP